MAIDAQDDKSDHPGVIAPPPLIYLGFLALGFLLDWFWPVTVHVPNFLRYGLALALASVGVVIALAAFREFRRAKTNVLPHKPTTAIITSGPFASMRNPLYLALALLHSAVAIAAGNAWALMLLAPALLVINYFVIAREERYLEAKFGEDYLTYKNRVSRWF
jgi:protein-S-isoprenylcysteine O-methyltransferase Ste14